MTTYDLTFMLYPSECPESIQVWASSLIRMRIGNKRVAGWRWDGTSDEIILILSKGMKLQRIPPNVWARSQFPVGTRVRQDVYGDAVFVVVDHRRGDAVLKNEQFVTYHQADIRHLEKVEDSEGNEDTQSPAGRGRSAAGDVRPVSVTAARGLGENVPRAVSSLSPRMQGEG